MTRLVATLALVSALLLAGCMSGEEAAPAQTIKAANTAEEAGALAGPAPEAPRSPYMVAPSSAAPDEKVVAYPAIVETNPAKAPVELDLSGEFGPADCRPFRLGMLDQATGGGPHRATNFEDQFAIGDVFSYEIVMSYTNTQQSWAEIHPVYGIGSTVEAHSDPTQDVREPIVITWTGQGFRANEDDMAWIMVDCWYGAVTTPIAYDLKIRLTFADSAVPAQAPMLVPVPAEATRVFVRGVPIDASKGVLSHFRFFDPQDELVCECALSSNEEVAAIEVPKGGGDYALLVDHTDNGFVSIAFDAPPAAAVVPLKTEWVVTPILESEGGPVDKLVDVELATVPLLMHAWVNDAGGSGVGKKTAIHVQNQRGPVLTIAWGGHVTYAAGEQTAWLGYWPADWAYEVDHHAFAPGAHQVHVSAEYLRGTVDLITRQYVR